MLRTVFRNSAAIRPVAVQAFRPAPISMRCYSAAPTEQEAPEEVSPLQKELDELKAKLEEKSKEVAVIKDARLRTLADFENLQKTSAKQIAQAKDYALTSFAKELVGSIDILQLALKSVAEEKLEGNVDLKSLHDGVSLTKKEIEGVLKRHGITAFDPTGEQFDPNLHEALFQAPIPGKEKNSVLECQELGYMIKDRLLRPAKVGVVQ